MLEMIGENHTNFDSYKIINLGYCERVLKDN